MGKMRIGFDAFNLWLPNGNSVYTANLIRALSALNPDLELHLFTQRRRLQRVRGAVGEASTISYRACLFHPLTLGPLFEGAVRMINDLIMGAKTEALDLFHCTNPANYPWRSQKAVLTLLDLIALRDENWTSEGSKRYYRRHIRTIVESATAITTISEHTKRDLARHFPQAVSKTTVIHIAGNPIYRTTTPDPTVLDRHGVRADRPYLLYVGQYQPRKNITGMLRAFSLLDEDLRREFAFVLAGSKMKSYMFDEILGEIDSLRNDVDVHVLVDVPDEDLLHLYNGAAVFVFLPFYEGFGVPVVEAMACGRPVLTSSVSSLPEVAGEAALLADPGDTAEISAAMDRLLRDEALRDDLAQRGLRRSRDFSWERTAAATMALYESVM